MSRAGASEAGTRCEAETNSSFRRALWPIVPGFALVVENGTLSKSHPCAPVAQLDRAVASEATGREFESLRAHHIFCRFAPNRLRRIPLSKLFSLDAEGSARKSGLAHPKKASVFVTWLQQTRSLP